MADEDEDWRFAVDDVGDPEEASENESDGEGSAEPGETGTVDRRPPLEPGSPSLENTLFVLLGVFVTLFVIVRVMTIVGG